MVARGEKRTPNAEKRRLLLTVTGTAAMSMPIGPSIDPDRYFDTGESETASALLCDNSLQQGVTREPGGRSILIAEGQK